jgi:hypothetical protein
MAMSARRNWSPSNSAIFFPNCSRSFMYRAATSNAPWAIPSAGPAMVGRE